MPWDLNQTSQRRPVFRYPRLIHRCMIALTYPMIARRFQLTNQILPFHYITSKSLCISILLTKLRNVKHELLITSRNKNTLSLLPVTRGGRPKSGGRVLLSPILYTYICYKIIGNDGNEARKALAQWDVPPFPFPFPVTRSRQSKQWLGGSKKERRGTTLKPSPSSRLFPIRFIRSQLPRSERLRVSPGLLSP